jgi:hypothetical protein
MVWSESRRSASSNPFFIYPGAVVHKVIR